MADKVLIPKQTAVGTATFKVRHNRPQTLYVYPNDDLDGEAISIERVDPDGVANAEYDYGFGGAIELTASATGVTIQGEGEYQVSKPVTTNSVGVAMADQDDA